MILVNSDMCPDALQRILCMTYFFDAVTLGPIAEIQQSVVRELSQAVGDV